MFCYFINDLLHSPPITYIENLMTSDVKWRTKHFVFVYMYLIDMVVC